MMRKYDDIDVRLSEGIKKNTRLPKIHLSYISQRQVVSSHCDANLSVK